MRKVSTPKKSISKKELKKLIAEDKKLTAELAGMETKRKRIREQITLFMNTNDLKRIEDPDSKREIILIKKSATSFIKEAFMKLTKEKLWQVCVPQMKLLKKNIDKDDIEDYCKIDENAGDPYIKISDIKESMDKKNVL